MTDRGRDSASPGVGPRRPRRIRAWHVSRLGLAVAGLLWAAATAGGASAGPAKLGDPNRSVDVHRIPLLDEDGETIDPDKPPVMPFSNRVTCGRCHNYSTVGGGLHFNYPDPAAPPGRAGQPWIWSDARTGTQMPVSHRPWPGTFRPGEVGLTPWKFIGQFGRHLPGGGVGDKFSDKPDDPNARWMVSGKLEINCMGCHNADRNQDQSAWATNLASENLKWAATAASPLALVRGSAKSMPDTWDPYSPPDLDHPGRVPPTVAYDKWRFNPKKEVYFDIGPQPDANRCYFCHTSHAVGQDKWRQDRDVHLAAGLTCTDCHRNGLDHAMMRGYEGEHRDYGRPEAAEFSCRGCHLGQGSPADQPATARQAGRLGAPRPQHKGLPSLHLDKLSCTACHSGPMPAQRAGRVQTSRAHAFGVREVAHTDAMLPHLVWPVFRRGPDGKLAPHKMIYPAYWARIEDQALTPIAPDALGEQAQAILEANKTVIAGKPQHKPPSDEQVLAILKILAAYKDAGAPAYVAAGKMHRLADGGSVEAVDHPAAAPYAWAFAHDVRPAVQSLGAGGCTDCHSPDSAFFFAKVPVDSPVALGEPVDRPMCELMGADPTFQWLFGFTFYFRPWLKLTCLAAAGVLVCVLVLYFFQGLGAVLKGGRRGQRNP